MPYLEVVRVAIVLESAPHIPYWHEAVERLVELDVKVSVVVLGHEGPLLEAARSVGACGLALGASSVAGYPRAVVRLRRRFRAWRPDIVHTVGSVPTSVGGLAACTARSGFRLFHRHHLTSFERAPFPSLANRLSQGVMAVSGATAAAVRSEGTGVPVWIAHNGIAAPRAVSRGEHARAAAALGVTDGDVVLLLLAHLKPGKGHELLLDALSDVAARTGRRVIAAFVGEGPLRVRLETEIARRGIDAVLVGHQRDIWPWFAVADVAVLPSDEESFGLAVVEAMASRTPVVASAVGGLLEVVDDGISGLLVPPGDPTALSAAIAAVVNDAALAERLRSGGWLRYQERFTIEAMVDRWIDCYRSCLMTSSTDGRG